MDRTLHDAQNAKKILQITADTMILVDQDETLIHTVVFGFCRKRNYWEKTYLIYYLCIPVRSWSRFSDRL